MSGQDIVFGSLGVTILREIIMQITKFNASFQSWIICNYRTIQDPDKSYPCRTVSTSIAHKEIFRGYANFSVSLDAYALPQAEWLDQTLYELRMSQPLFRMQASSEEFVIPKHYPCVLRRSNIHKLLLLIAYPQFKFMRRYATFIVAIRIWVTHSLNRTLCDDFEW